MPALSAFRASVEAASLISVAGQLHRGDSLASATMELHGVGQRVLGGELTHSVNLADLRQQACFPQAVKLPDHPLLVPQKPLVHRAVEYLLEGVHSGFGKLKM